MKKYRLTIDHELCWGCKTCEVACKQEHNTPVGVRLISIVDDKSSLVFESTVCQHCDAPACVASCPEKAIVQRDDGIVILIEDDCSGCRRCLDACPFHAISFDEQNNVARKCNLCHHRIDRGLIPACADNVCLSHCIYFGDPDDFREQTAGKPPIPRFGAQ